MAIAQVSYSLVGGVQYQAGYAGSQIQYGAPFDPMTLVPSSWIGGQPGGGPFALPWVYTTLPGSAGVPPEETTFSGDAPTAGRVVDGFASARYDSIGGRNAHTNTDGGSTFTDAFITLSAYTIMGLIYVDSAPAYDGGAPYHNPTIMQCDARWGCSFSGAGVGMYHFDGGFPNRQEAWATARWNFFCVRFGGALGAHFVQVDVNTTAGTPTNLGSNISVLGLGNTTGNNISAFNGGISNSFDLMERLTLQRSCTDAERDDYYRYLKATYPSAGLP